MPWGASIIGTFYVDVRSAAVSAGMYGRFARRPTTEMSLWISA